VAEVRRDSSSTLHWRLIGTSESLIQYSRTELAVNRYGGDCAPSALDSPDHGPRGATTRRQVWLPTPTFAIVHTRMEVCSSNQGRTRRDKGARGRRVPDSRHARPPVGTTSLNCPIDWPARRTLDGRAGRRPQHRVINVSTGPCRQRRRPLRAGRLLQPIRRSGIGLQPRSAAHHPSLASRESCHERGGTLHGAGERERTNRTSQPGPQFVREC